MSDQDPTLPAPALSDDALDTVKGGSAVHPIGLTSNDPRHPVPAFKKRIYVDSDGRPIF